MTIFRHSLLILLSVAAITITGIAILLFAAQWLFPQWYGSYSLGNGLYMMEWDSPGRIIVQGSYIRGNTCYGGSLIIPTYDEEYDSLGNWKEWVVEASSNERWVAAYTYNTDLKGYKYYVLDKLFDTTLDVDEIVRRYRKVYVDKDSFDAFCKKEGIVMLKTR